MKTCNKCGLSGPDVTFGSVWNGNRCRGCHATQKREWRAANPVRAAKISAKSRAKRVEYYREYARRAHQDLRAEVLAALGGVCECCGETAEPFLSLEHRNGTGALHRKLVHRGVYADVKRQGFPREKFGLLCMNCNVATKGGRECPHVTEMKRLRLA